MKINNLKTCLKMLKFAIEVFDYDGQKVWRQRIKSIIDNDKFINLEK